ncbi:HAD family hydrolase [Bacillus sp. T33-2]|uniref:HAD family hydrolase n=1 Tax=Bacillus sp. T33-2 TaxID=2054168 RepID=UPI0035B52EB4
MKAIIFDFDGTIVDTETLWFKVFKEVLETEYSFNLQLEEFAKCIGTTDDVLYDYIDRHAGIPVDREGTKAKVHEKFHQLKDILVLREGIKELIYDMSERGLLLGVASSSARDWVEDYLEKFGIRKYFRSIKTKEDVEKVKPDPALYIKALEALKVKPDEAIAIEDSINGSIAALEAGVKCVVVPNDVTEFMTFHEKAYRYKMFSELPLDELL